VNSTASSAIPGYTLFALSERVLSVEPDAAETWDCMGDLLFWLQALKNQAGS